MSVGVGVWECGSEGCGDVSVGGYTQHRNQVVGVYMETRIQAASRDERHKACVTHLSVYSLAPLCLAGHTRVSSQAETC